MKPKLLMPDVDGVLFGIQSRLDYALEIYMRSIPDELAYLRTRKHAEEDATYWGTVFRCDLLSMDIPIDGTREDLMAFEEAGYEIIFHTSRPDSMQDATIQQLTQHGFFTSTRELIMKPSDLRIVTKTLKVAYAYGQVCTHRYPEFVFVDDTHVNVEEVKRYVSPICNMRAYLSLAEAAADLRGQKLTGDVV